MFYFYMSFIYLSIYLFARKAKLFLTAVWIKLTITTIIGACFWWCDVFQQVVFFLKVPFVRIVVFFSLIPNSPKNGALGL